MNYKKTYVRLIRKAQKKNLDRISGIEKHHIFPKSIFGKNKNVVYLTTKEHYIAHLLLWKYYKKVVGEQHNKTIKMMFAINLMSNRFKSNSRLYSIFKKGMSNEKTKFMLGPNNPMRHSYTVDKLRGENNPAKRPEVREKISAALKGKFLTEEHKLKLSKAKRAKANAIERIDVNSRRG